MILATGITGTIFATVAAFLIISLVLIALLLFVKQKLSPSGPVKITINGETYEYSRLTRDLYLKETRYPMAKCLRSGIIYKSPIHII